MHLHEDAKSFSLSHIFFQEIWESPEYGSPVQTKAQTRWQGIKGMSLDAIADLLSMEPSEVARILARQETNTEDRASFVAWGVAS